MLLAVVILVLASMAHCLSGVPEFVQYPAGRLDVQEGLFPARELNPSFGFAYYGVPEISENAFLAQGEFGKDCYRVAFRSSFLMEDSVYRRSYTEVSGTFISDILLAGAGYGFSMEWIPFLGDQWARHQLIYGGSLLWKGLSLGGALYGWTDDLYNPDYVVGVHLRGKRFKAFVEYDGKAFELGNGIRFRFIDVLISYRFPGFGVSLSLVFCLNSFSSGIDYGFSNDSLEWFGGWFSKKISKKTIL